VIGLLIEKQVTYTEVEVDALVAQAKKMATESGGTVRAEAERLLSTDRETRLQDLHNKVVEASALLEAIAIEVVDFRVESSDDDVDLASILVTMAVSCAPFTSVPEHGSTSTTRFRKSPASPAETVLPGPIETVESPRLNVTLAPGRRQS
jgi:hypothetical protein